MCSVEHLGQFRVSIGGAPGSMGILEANREAPEVSYLSADPKAATEPGRVGTRSVDIQRTFSVCWLDILRVSTR